MNKELYNNYLRTKAKVDLLHNQMIDIANQLHTAENELRTIENQVKEAADDALLATLLL